MRQRHFLLIIGIVFSVVAVVHCVRIVFAVTLVVQGFPIPTWMSWIAVVVSGFLGYQALHLARESKSDKPESQGLTDSEFARVQFVNPSTKELFAALDSLRKSASDRSQKRWEFEWRLALALWAGLGAFAGLTVAKDSALQGWDVVCVAAVVTLLLVLLHMSLLTFFTSANKFDSDMSFDYEDEMHKLIGWNFPDEKVTIRRKKIRHEHRTFWNHPSPRFQLCITLLLGIIVVAVVSWKTVTAQALLPINKFFSPF